MPKKRTKTAALPELSRQQAETALSEFAATDARIDSLEAHMNEEMAAIRDRYKEELEPLFEQRDQLEAQLQAFAEKNKEELFSKRRSLPMLAGMIGFRKGTPKLKPRKGFTWAAILEMAKTLHPAWVRTKEEVNKELMLNERELEGNAQLIEKCGAEVVADESFFIELKKEEVSA